MPPVVGFSTSIVGGWNDAAPGAHALTTMPALVMVGVGGVVVVGILDAAEDDDPRAEVACCAAFDEEQSVSRIAIAMVPAVPMMDLIQDVTVERQRDGG